MPKTNVIRAVSFETAYPWLFPFHTDRSIALDAINIQKGNTIDRNNAKFTSKGKKTGGGFGVKLMYLGRIIRSLHKYKVKSGLTLKNVDKVFQECPEFFTK